MSDLQKEFVSRSSVYGITELRRSTFFQKIDDHQNQANKLVKPTIVDDKASRDRRSHKVV